MVPRIHRSMRGAGQVFVIRSDLSTCDIAGNVVAVLLDAPDAQMHGHS